MGDKSLGTVVDLRTRSTYQPDYAALARNRLAMARRSLGLSHEEFAAMLRPLLGCTVSGDIVRAWETDVVPPGDALIAAGTVSPASTDRLGIRSHKFIPAYIGTEGIKHLSGSVPCADLPDGTACETILIDSPTGECHLYLWPFGVAVAHLVEDLELPDIASLALWRYRSYEENLDWLTAYLRNATGDSGVTASYVLSLYWLHSAVWLGPALGTALRIICAPRVLLDRTTENVEESQCIAEQAERSLLAEGFSPEEMRSFGVKSVGAGYASWSGVVYHPLDPSRALREHELVSFELTVQALWAYCEAINGAVENGGEPRVPSGFGWRFLRGARSRLFNPRSQETGQHRAMRSAVVETSGILGHLDQAIEVLHEANER